MAQRSKQLKTDCEPGLHERVVRYQKERGLEYKSTAVKELVQTGLRERESVLGESLKSAAVQTGVLFVLTGLCVATIGVATPVVEPFVAGQVAAVLVLLGGAVVAGAEVLRLLAGRNELGAALRRWRA